VRKENLPEAELIVKRPRKVVLEKVGGGPGQD